MIDYQLTRSYVYICIYLKQITQIHLSQMLYIRKLIHFPIWPNLGILSHLNTVWLLMVSST